jgi:hypothetical protein
MVVIDAPPLPIGAWRLVAVALTGEEAILYVDGEPAGSNRVKLERIDVFRGSDNWIGRSLSAGPNFNGLIGGLRIYDRALSQAELLNLKDGAPPR